MTGEECFPVTELETKCRKRGRRHIRTALEMVNGHLPPCVCPAKMMLRLEELKHLNHTCRGFL